MESLFAVKDRIRTACQLANRPPEAVQLIAVSKKIPNDRIITAHATGHRHFGENRAQELRDKAAALTTDISWHFIGQLQQNKAKYVARVAHRVHALENRAQAEALAKHAPKAIQCLLAVNLRNEPAKGGLAPSQVLPQCEEFAGVSGVDVVGLMCIPPFQADPQQAAPYFEELAELARNAQQGGFPLTELSMGMSHDFEVAIAHGATWIRVGTAIFGARS